MTDPYGTLRQLSRQSHAWHTAICIPSVDSIQTHGKAVTACSNKECAQSLQAVNVYSALASTLRPSPSPLSCALQLVHIYALTGSLASRIGALVEGTEAVVSSSLSSA